MRLAAHARNQRCALCHTRASKLECTVLHHVCAMYLLYCYAPSALFVKCMLIYRLVVFSSQLFPTTSFPRTYACLFYFRHLSPSFSIFGFHSVPAILYSNLNLTAGELFDLYSLQIHNYGQTFPQHFSEGCKTPPSFRPGVGIFPKSSRYLDSNRNLCHHHGKYIGRHPRL